MTAAQSQGSDFDRSRQLPNLEYLYLALGSRIGLLLVPIESYIFFRDWKPLRR